MSLNDYDLRQLNLMKHKIISFNEESISLKSLIDDLRALLNCLQSVTDEWKEKFHETWFNLELIYSIAVDEQESLSKSSVEIKSSVNALKKQVEELINPDCQPRLFICD